MQAEKNLKPAVKKISRPYALPAINRNKKPKAISISADPTLDWLWYYAS